MAAAACLEGREEGRRPRKTGGDGERKGEEGRAMRGKNEKGWGLLREYEETEGKRKIGSRRKVERVQRERGRG